MFYNNIAFSNYFPGKILILNIPKSLYILFYSFSTVNIFFTKKEAYASF